MLSCFVWPLHWRQMAPYSRQKQHISRQIHIKPATGIALLNGFLQAQYLGKPRLLVTLLQICLGERWRSMAREECIWLLTLDSGSIMCLTPQSIESNRLTLFSEGMGKDKPLQRHVLLPRPARGRIWWLRYAGYLSALSRHIQSHLAMHDPPTTQPFKS